MRIQRGLPLLFSLLLLPAPSGTAHAAGNPPRPVVAPTTAGFSPERLDRLHSNLAGHIDSGAYAGYVVLLARDGRLADWRAHGWQDIEAKVPMAKDSIVQIQSMTKIVTSVAILMLMEDGKLKLQDPVEHFLPALRHRQVLIDGTADAPVLVPAVRPLTVLDLLTHTAGYYYDESWSVDSPVAIELFKRARIWKATSTDEFVQRVASIPLREQPGTRFRYGIATDLLGAIVEKASGLSLAAYFQDRIFQPLGMVDSGFHVPADKLGRLAKTYRRNGAGQLESAPPLPGTESREGDTFFSGGGGLRSTAADYARFAQMLLNGGQLNGRRLLSRKSVELMTTNQIAHLADPHPFANQHLGFGLGVRIVTNLGRSPHLGSPGMFGWDGGTTTLVWMDPKERLVAILLTQHLPYNEHDIFTTFVNGYHAALVD